MLTEIEPRIVLVYGAMPDKLFQRLDVKTQFIHYPD